MVKADVIWEGGEEEAKLMCIIYSRVLTLASFLSTLKYSHVVKGLG